MALSKNLLKDNHNIIGIKYFTARISDNGHNSASQRQAVYIDALSKFIPELSIYYGYFIRRIMKLRSADPSLNGAKVPVTKNEEKGSDVNLAVHLLNDAWLDKYQSAMIISNDSDLEEALRLVKEPLEKEIILTNPHKSRTSHKLKAHANKVKRIDQEILRNSQLPDKIPDTNFYKPSSW